MKPRIQYARTSDGVSIAYHAIGDGPALVYLIPVSLLVKEWAYPEQRAWLERLAQHHRVIRLDSRGIGLSDRHVGFESDSISLDVDAVVRKEGLKRFALMGDMSAAAVAIVYACRFPERVSHLVLWSPYGPDSVDSSPPFQAVRAAATKDWRTYMQLCEGRRSQPRRGDRICVSSRHRSCLVNRRRQRLHKARLPAAAR
jgi:pimeloyl-ACP methyl ester carboxylesterase